MNEMGKMTKHTEMCVLQGPLESEFLGFFEDHLQGMIDNFLPAPRSPPPVFLCRFGIKLDKRLFSILLGGTPLSVRLAFLLYM